MIAGCRPAVFMVLRYKLLLTHNAIFSNERVMPRKVTLVNLCLNPSWMNELHCLSLLVYRRIPYLHIPCFQNVLTPLDFFHILLCYSVIQIYLIVIYTKYSVMLKWKNNYMYFFVLNINLKH